MNSAVPPAPSRTMRLLWAGHTVSVLGDRVAAFALVFWILRETGSAGMLATLALVQFVVELAVLPVAGALVDRANRGRLLILTNLCGAALFLGAAALLREGALPLWGVFLLLGVDVTVITFYRLLFKTVVPRVVAPERLVRANSLIQGSESLAQVVGPAAAGAVLALASESAWPLFVVNAASFALGAACVAASRIPRDGSITERRPARGHAREGFRYLVQHPHLLRLHGLLSLVNFFAMPVIMLLWPGLAVNGSALLSLGLGSLLSVFGAGLLAGSVVMAAGRRSVASPASIGAAVASAGGFVLLSGAVRAWPLVLLAVGATGFAFQVSRIHTTAYLQGVVPGVLHGRVFAAGSVIAQVSAPLALAAYGVTADRAGVAALLLVNGVGLMLVGAALAAVRVGGRAGAGASPARAPDTARAGVQLSA